MHRFELFTRKRCTQCNPAKSLIGQLQSEGYQVVEYDLDTTDGLAEGAFHSVLATPTLLLVNDEDDVLADWRGDVPTLDSVKQEIERHQSHAV
jgi:hypothetical protein